MADQLTSLTVEGLRHVLAQKAREISELDVMLADYQAERDRLIRELRALQARLDELLEQMRAHPKSPSEKENHPT